MGRVVESSGKGGTPDTMRQCGTCARLSVKANSDVSAFAAGIPHHEAGTVTCPPLARAHTRTTAPNRVSASVVAVVVVGFMGALGGAEGGQGGGVWEDGGGGDAFLTAGER